VQFNFHILKMYYIGLIRPSFVDNQCKWFSRNTHLIIVDIGVSIEPTNLSDYILLYISVNTDVLVDVQMIGY
jgi:hypothetical protein